MSRPYVTMFMLQSVDGKISTGESNNRGFEVDLPVLEVGKGLYQYYDALDKTDLFFLITGKSIVRGLYAYDGTVPKCAATCVVLDEDWLNTEAVGILCDMYKEVIVFTGRYALMVRDNLHWVTNAGMSLDDIMHCLSTVYGCERLSLQGGSYLNSAMIKNHYVDELNLIVAPILVGGNYTPGLIGGRSAESLEDVENLAQLELLSVDKLQFNYVQFKYKLHYVNTAKLVERK